MSRYFHDKVEIARRGTGTTPVTPLSLVFEADFILDLVTFKVLKHRYDTTNCTYKQAHEWLTAYLEDGITRILLLVD